MSEDFLSEAEIRWAHEKWCNSYSLREIAAALYVSEKCLRRHLTLRGLKKDTVPLHYDFTKEGKSK